MEKKFLFQNYRTLEKNPTKFKNCFFFEDFLKILELNIRKFQENDSFFWKPNFQIIFIIEIQQSNEILKKITWKIKF